MGVAGEVALVALAAYSAYETDKAAKKKPEMPTAPAEEAKLPQSPQLDVGTQNAISQKEAETAAGTIFSPNPGEAGGKISNDPLTPRKTLLGT